MRRSSFRAVLFTLCMALTIVVPASAAPAAKAAHNLAWYSAHYKKHQDLASLKAVTRSIKKGWKLRQAQALLGEGIDMGYGGYRYTAKGTDVGLELRIDPSGGGADATITDKTIMRFRE